MPRFEVLSVARSWKRMVERVLAASGLAQALGRLQGPATAVLAYHNIVPRGSAVGGDVSLHLDQSAFAAQLDFLTEVADVVALESLEAAHPEVGRRGRPQVVLTFDDAYMGTMIAGVEELRARGLPATVFVPPGLLGQRAFWWDELSPDGGAPLAAGVRAHALTGLAGRRAAVLDWAAQQGIRPIALPDHTRPSDEATLLAGASYERLSLGAHTWSHPNLAALTTQEVVCELEQSRAWLVGRAERYADWLTYPYGLRTDDTVSLASRHFKGAFVIDGGLTRARGRERGPRHALPRINIPRGLTLEGLALRLAGMLS